MSGFFANHSGCCPSVAEMKTEVNEVVNPLCRRPPSKILQMLLGQFAAERKEIKH